MPSSLTSYYHSKPEPAKSSGNNRPAGNTPLPSRIKRIIGWALTRIGLLAALFAYVYWGLLLSPTAKLSVTKGNQYRPTSDYQTAITQHLNKLRNSTKVTFDSASIASTIKAAFPEIDSAIVELPFIGRQPVVRLSVFAPVLYLETSGKTYVISSNGAVVGEASRLLPFKNLPIVVDQSGADIVSRQQVLSPQQVSFIGVLVAQAEYAKVSIDSFILPSSTQEIYMKLTGAGYYVKFYTGGDPAEQAGRLFATLRHIKTKHITPTRYIDVGVAGKVYYM